MARSNTIGTSLRGGGIRAGMLPYLLVGPGAIFVGAFTLLALAYTLFASFTDWDIGRPNGTSSVWATSSAPRSIR
jgi:ABC-type sugar transport system permease subunit